jgi:nucleoside-diphosphate-sugar epimerase
MKNILITGANGFIGQILVAALKAKNCRIIALVRQKHTGPWDQAVFGDIRVPLTVSESLHCDTVFHLAGKAHALSEHAGEEAEYHAVNTEGTRNVLDLAKKMGAKRFVYFSSIKAMGEVGEGHDETVDVIPGRRTGFPNLRLKNWCSKADMSPIPW